VTPEHTPVAKFEIEQSEGMRWVKVTLKDDAVRAEPGALSHLRGNIVMDVPLPSFRGWLVSTFANETMLRPRYRGTGELYLESSLGGFHALQVKPGETWVIDDGAYWASDDEVELSIYREGMMTSYWAGEGLFWYKTRVRGRGTVVLATPGPVEEVNLTNGQVMVDGKYVLARTASLKFSIRRPARGVMGYFYSGEQCARTYQGTGRLLISTTPYWRLRVSQSKQSKDPLLADAE
jgi:uncharacterized protein (AIM24 family)